MFFEAGYNSPVFTIDVSSFDTSNVKDMGGMFSAIGRYSQEYTLNVSNFDTSNVTDMSYMFYMNGYNNPNFTLNIDNLDTRNVTSMSGMFSGVAYNNKVFTLDISHFEVPKLLNISWMFSSTGTNSENLTIILGDFNTSNVGNMEGVFYETGYNTKELNIDLSKLSFKKAYNTSSMFFNTGYNNDNLNLTITIDSPYITTYTSMFSNVAIKENNKLIVNYKSSTEALVEQMINTKSDGANVVKGYNISKTIKFTVEESEYTAYENMTWEQWITSEFNIDGFYLNNDSIKNNIDTELILLRGSDWVSAEEKIIPDYNYDFEYPTPV
jgi:surface protein